MKLCPDESYDAKSFVEEYLNSDGSKHIKLNDMAEHIDVIYKLVEIINEKSKEIDTLQQENFNLARAHSADPPAPSNNMLSRDRDCDEEDYEINRKMRLELMQMEDELEMTKKQLDTHKELVDGYQKENIEAVKLLESTIKSLDSSYSAEELSRHLNETIESFNANVDESDSEVGYMIDEMDIDLKAVVFKDEENKLRFSSANVTTNDPDAMSTIKISIKAVPK